MLSAVPSQPMYTPVVPREEAFRRAAEEALQLSGPEALAQIMKLYTADTRGLLARAEGHELEASALAEDKRRYFTMLEHVQAAASNKLRETSAMAAELATYREIFGQIRSLADKAAGEPLEWESVAAALSAEPMAPVFQTTTLAFQPSEQFRGGQFISHPTPDVTFVFTFIGWALVDHGPGAYGIIEPMFLVQDRAMPRSVIEYERHVKFEAYLPHIGSRAA